MKKSIIVLLAIILFQTVFTSYSLVLAESNNQSRYDNRSFSAMFNRLYNDDNSRIVVYSGDDIVTETFIQNTFAYYAVNDVDSIYRYMIDNNIIISDGNDSKSNVPDMNSRAIYTSVYTSSDRYAVLSGTSPYGGGSISLPIIYTVSITVPYDFATGLVSGTLRNPIISISSTDGVADSWSAYSVNCSKSITNGGYSVHYSNISFIVEARIDWVWQTYNRYYDNLVVDFTPAA